MNKKLNDIDLKPSDLKPSDLKPSDLKQRVLKNNRLRPRDQIQTILLLLMTGFGIYLCYEMALLFLPALVWALTLAVLFVPFQVWLELKLKHHSLASLVAVVAISLIGIAPVIMMGQQLAIQAVNGAQLIETKVNSGEWRRIVYAQPRLAPIAKHIEKQINLPDTIKSFTLWVSNAAGSIIKGSLYQVVGFVLTIYMLFFFLRDRQSITQALCKLLPLADNEIADLLKRISDTIHATVYGILAVAAVQGFLGGLIFWWLGLPAPLLWGAMMSLLAVIPVLGSSIIWLPAALFLAIEGNWQQAIILVLWGMLVVGTVDNVLRPILVGNRLKLHTLLAFMSVVGGLVLFGSSGLILGPVVLAITLFLISIWTTKTPTQTNTS